MFVLLCILACAVAAPQLQRNEYMGTGLMDNLNKEMARLSETMAKMSNKLQSKYSVSQGNQYNINITLTGFDEKDITVKAMKGSVQVRAVHKSEHGDNNYYMDNALPQFVKADSGSWVYEGGVLKIVFAVEDNRNTTEAAVGPIVFKNKVEFMPGQSGWSWSIIA